MGRTIDVPIDSIEQELGFEKDENGKIILVVNLKSVKAEKNKENDSGEIHS